MTLRERAERLKTDVPAVLLALGRKDTPWYAKAAAGLTAAYALSPVDLIPDFIPVLGYLDDVLVLPALVALTVRLVPARIFAECRAQAAREQSAGAKKKRYFALPILLLWAVVLVWALRLIINK